MRRVFSELQLACIKAEFTHQINFPYLPILEGCEGHKKRCNISDEW